MIRYVENFIIVTNDYKQIEIINKKLDAFIEARGLKRNVVKSSYFQWVSGAKFEFLGFIFLNTMRNKKSNLTFQCKRGHNVLCGGLHVTPSKASIKILKTKIKEMTTRSNSHQTPYIMVNLLNIIIRE
jgi:hypothetical protein